MARPGGDVYVVGVGMTQFGKFADRSVRDLTRTAVGAALEDAGIGKERIEAAYFANAAQGAMEGQFNVRGQMALRPMGFQGIPITNVENACASASTAFHLAAQQIRAGLADVVLAVGSEKLYSADKERTFAVFNGAWDVQNAEATMKGLLELGEGIEPPAGTEEPKQKSLFMDVYAALSRFHMKKFGTTERQLAAVSAKNHGHAAHNPLSQYRDPMSIDEVLGARMISWPLTLPMCAPISDGAAAAVLCSKEALAGFDRSRAIRVRASVLATSLDRRADELDKHITRRAALRAYAAAGLSPEQMSLAEVHDATAFAEVQQLESLGFCKLGEGGPLSESGATRLGGSIPVNVSGGLECKGHPIGATGLGQLYELVVQLRGEAGARQVKNARFGIAENGGGFYRWEEATACITILGTE